MTLKEYLAEAEEKKSFFNKIKEYKDEIFAVVGTLVGTLTLILSTVGVAVNIGDSSWNYTNARNLINDLKNSQTNLTEIYKKYAKSDGGISKEIIRQIDDETKRLNNVIDKAEKITYNESLLNKLSPKERKRVKNLVKKLQIQKAIANEKREEIRNNADVHKYHDMKDAGELDYNPFTIRGNCYRKAWKEENFTDPHKNGPMHLRFDFNH